MPDKNPVADCHTTTYGATVINYEVRRSRTDRLRIDVYPDLRVIVTAPKGKPIEEVRRRVRRKARWITRQLRLFGNYHPLPKAKRYVSGESFYYLGRQYRLKLNKGDIDEVKLLGPFLRASTKEPSSPTKVKALLNDWYRERAKAYFRARMKLCIQRLNGKKLGAVGVQIRQMKSRWGSCSRAGMITLNLDLIKAPSHCIDYVIIHELCHLKHHDHSSAFYKLLEHYVPDWQTLRQKLNRTQI